MNGIVKYGTWWLVAWGWGGAQEESSVTPRPHECTLTYEELVLPVEEVVEEPFTVHAEGGWRVQVGAEMIRVRSAAEPSVAWETKPLSMRMDLVTIRGDVAWFLWNDHIGRLDLEAQQWLESMSVRELADDLKLTVVVGLMVIEDDFVIVTYRAPLVVRTLGITVSTGECRWSHKLPSSAQRGYTGGYLSASRRPRYSYSSLRPLSKREGGGNAVLVCTGERGVVAAIDVETGEEHWRLDHLWEYERAFIGPSMWSHHLARFGTGSDISSGHDPELRQRRAEFEEKWEGMLLGGPVCVSSPPDSLLPGDTILVATGCAPKGNWTGYLVDGRMYEIDGGGSPISVTNLPRPVNGGQWTRTTDGVVWACSNGAFVKMVPSASATEFSLGPGGPDARGRVAWYRELVRPSIPAWLASNPGADPVVFLSGFAIRPADGGYVLREEDQVMHFPLWLVDLDDGGAELLDLQVPFEGHLALPTTNYGRNGSAIRAHGPYGFALGWMQGESETLYATVGLPESQHTVAFDLAPLFRLLEKED